MKNPRALAPVVVAAGVLGVSTAAVLVRLSQAPPLVIAVYRMALSVILLLPVWQLQRLRQEKVHQNERDERDEGACTAVMWAVLAGICLAAHWSLWFAALGITSVASATVLVTIHPVFTIAGTWIIWRQATSRMSIIAVALALLGSLLIGAGGGGTDSLVGNTYAILAAAAVAVYFLIGQHVRRKIGLLAYVIPVYASGAVVATIVAIVAKVPLYPYPAQEWGLFLLLAIGPTLLGHTLFTWALQYISATNVSLAVLGEPVLAALWAVVLFGEIPTLYEIGGAVLIISGIAFYTRSNAPV